MRHLYVVVIVTDPATLARLQRAVARPWLMAYRNHVRYWVPNLEAAEAERAVLALAGIKSFIEGLDFQPTEK